MEQQTRIISFSSFPIKLHSILSNPRLSHIISWLPHGRSWRINNHKEFEQKIIPRYFRHRNLSSFMRQVNGWGFHRITAGLDRNSYYLEKFLRGKSSLCKQIKRPSSKAVRQARLRSSNEPNFYEMSMKNPLPEDTPNKTHLERNANHAQHVWLHSIPSSMLQTGADPSHKLHLPHSLQPNHFPTEISHSQIPLDCGISKTQIRHDLQQPPRLSTLTSIQESSNSMSMITDFHLSLVDLKIKELNKKRQMWLNM